MTGALFQTVISVDLKASNQEERNLEVTFIGPTCYHTAVAIIPLRKRKNGVCAPKAVTVAHFSCLHLLAPTDQFIRISSMFRIV